MQIRSWIRALQSRLTWSDDARLLDQSVEMISLSLSRIVELISVVLSSIDIEDALIIPLLR